LSSAIKAIDNDCALCAPFSIVNEFDDPFEPSTAINSEMSASPFFCSPGAPRAPCESALVNDTLRGSVLASIPFFDQKKVVGLLDSLHTMDEGTQVANDQVLMILVSACVLQERFGLEARNQPETRSSTLAS